MLEVFHALLRHLRVSIESEASDPRIKKDEEHFQEAIINTIGKCGFFGYGFSWNVCYFIGEMVEYSLYEQRIVVFMLNFQSYSY